MIKSIRIAGRTLSVVPSNEIVVDNDARGELSNRESKILICPLYEGQAQGETLMHEVIHVLNNTARLKLEHDVIDRLSHSMYAALRDNPCIAKHIIAGSKIVPRTA